MDLPIYYNFHKDKAKMLSMLQDGSQTNESIIAMLKRKYTVTKKARLSVSGLNKRPQDQTVDEWLQELKNS